ncbi:MAG: hypothetical protein ACYDHX_04715 [Methanothrix sp.]
MSKISKEGSGRGSGVKSSDKGLDKRNADKIIPQKKGNDKKDGK